MLQKAVLLILIITLTALAQSVVETADLRVVVDDIKVADQQFRDLLSQSQARIDNLNNNFQSQYISANITCGKTDFEKLLSGLLLLGYSENYKRLVVDTDDEMSDLLIEKSFNEKQLSDVIKEMSGIDKNSYRTIYDSFYNKKISLESEIFRLDRQLNNLKKQVKDYSIKLEIAQKKLYNYEEQSSGFFQFVNMPGIEGMYLKVENPEQGLSAKTYYGPMVKYLFTKGKSYAFFGALKANSTSDSAEVNDIFYYGIGHDFYPRYLGDGRGKYFNLYSGLAYGGMLTYAEDKSKYHLFFVTPHVGLELYKSTNILFDFKAGYLIPLEEKYHYNFRGLTLNSSLNFVF